MASNIQWLRSEYDFFFFFLSAFEGNKLIYCSASSGFLSRMAISMLCRMTRVERSRLLPGGYPHPLLVTDCFLLVVTPAKSSSGQQYVTWSRSFLQFLGSQKGGDTLGHESALSSFLGIVLVERFAVRLEDFFV